MARMKAMKPGRTPIDASLRTGRAAVMGLDTAYLEPAPPSAGAGTAPWSLLAALGMITSS
jgi:hypothetical protein